MITFAGTLLLAASLASLAQSAPQRLSLLDVPFISQSEALCGGAAVAMVLRFWGESSVSAEDFVALVDRKAGGIRTADLVAAVRRRGSKAVPASGTPALARAELMSGRPIIALIEDRPGAFHYVVIVGWHERGIVLHDPARTPYVVMRPAEFERRWQASASWMLAITPASQSRERTLHAPTPNFQPVQGSTGCDRLVADGVQLAQQHDLVSAERVLADAAYQCAGAAPLRELAGVRLLQRRWPEVRDLATRAVAIDPADMHAWRLLAASRYIGGDPAGALDAWNRAGEPIVDIVSASGLQRTMHRTVERLLRVEVGQALTRGHFERARRRLDELPAAFSTRLEYVPRGGGRAEVRGHVGEHTVIPRGGLTWTVIGARAAVSREVAFGITSLTRAGERLEARWRFWPHRPAYGVSLTTPVARLGILQLEGFAEKQPFTAPQLPAAERAGARLQLADWATGSFRWHVRSGVDRWARDGAFPVVGGGTRLEWRRAALTVDANTWLGEWRFATGRVAGAWSSSGARRGAVFLVAGGLEAVTSQTPLDLWAAGDTGHARAALLRAHPVLHDGRVDVERLGRQLAHVTGEAQHWWGGPGPLAMGAAFFVDTAHAGRRFTGDARIDTDIGAGLRIGIRGQRGVFRVDFAHGLRDGHNALSVAWQP